MKARRIRRTAVAGVTALIMAVGGFALYTPPLEAADCGDGDGKLCGSSEVCLDLGIFSFCSSSYRYYITP